jgi:hypothetical protein
MKKGKKNYRRCTCKVNIVARSPSHYYHINIKMPLFCVVPLRFDVNACMEILFTLK